MPRKRGRPPKGTLTPQEEAKFFARKICDDPIYRRQLLVRATEGKLHPSVEQMLWAYAYGRPPEQVKHTGSIALPVEIVHEHHVDPAPAAQQVAREAVRARLRAAGDVVDAEPVTSDADRAEA